MKITRIILDMDEVITDFVGAACRAWGTRTEEVLKNWEPGKWDMTEPVGKTIRGTPLAEKEFWDKINNNSEFWSEMNETLFVHDILSVVRTVVDINYHIVS